MRTVDVSHDRVAISAALRSTIRVGQDLSAPYARKWAVGGCEATNSLFTYPYDALEVFSTAISELDVSVWTSAHGLTVSRGDTRVWVAINRSIRGDGPPDAYLIGRYPDQLADYVGNAPQVVTHMLQRIDQPVQLVPEAPGLVVGFPGMEDRKLTYVGSWQWNVHGEARDDEFVGRAAVATMAAIRATNRSAY